MFLFKLKCLTVESRYMFYDFGDIVEVSCEKICFGATDIDNFILYQFYTLVHWNNGNCYLLYKTLF